MVPYVEVSLDGCMKTIYISSREVFLVDNREMEFARDWKLVAMEDGTFDLYLYGRPLKRYDYDDKEYKWISERYIYSVKTKAEYINKYEWLDL
jgi:hypothetical protein